jgi:hypothetical protein
LIIANNSGVSVLRNLSNDTFAQPVVTSWSIHLGGSLVHDFNGDGIPDIAVTDLTSRLLMIYFGSMDESFHVGPIAPTGASPVAITTMGSFIWIANYGSSQISVGTCA